MRHWNLEECVKQLEYCPYECEAGPLTKNDAFIWLKAAVQVGPKFMPGQGVFYKIETTVAGEDLSKWVHYYIVGCRMDSDTVRRFWRYDLSNDPPAPWHYGDVQHRSVPEDKLSLSTGE